MLEHAGALLDGSPERTPLAAREERQSARRGKKAALLAETQLGSSPSSARRRGKENAIPLQQQNTNVSVQGPASPFASLKEKDNSTPRRQVRTAEELRHQRKEVVHSYSFLRPRMLCVFRGTDCF